TEVVPAASSVTSAAAAPAAVAPATTDRFGRALTGGAGPSVPPVFQPGQPVVEVQPPPAPAPQPVVARTAPPPPAPPQRDVLHPEPAPAPQRAAPPSLPPEPAPSPAPAAEPEPSTGDSYTQIAVAAAAAALAAARAREAEAEAPAEPEAAPDEDTVGAEIDDDSSSRFGTPAASTPLEPAPGEPVDDLTRIRGIDVELKERLIRYGVHTFAAIAAWTPEDVRGVSQTLGFQGRIERENWIEQAQILAAGGDPGLAPRVAPAEAAVPVDGDRLNRILGIDPQSEDLLRANGVTQLAHIAAWSGDDIVWFEGLLGAPGRISREGWVEQARFLVRGLAPAAAEAPEALPSDAAPAASAPRSDIYVALRSVRSEALRGDGVVGVTTDAVDDLKRIRGIGVLIEKRLNSLGITAYEQVANWTRADIDRISGLLDFKGRIERENWIEQARILASGGQTEFSRRVDRGDA
ncbi:helix-hairpin-helix domain-containing protein, partial [Hyphomicrobium sp.]|uniref:helix-hairpin-helix domain-containing protein n=1 Tax=Hyphomicrobium sp. TaxID=82 RepID=UPI0025BF1B23